MLKVVSFLVLFVLQASAACTTNCSSGCASPYTSATCQTSGAWAISSSVALSDLSEIQCTVTVAGNVVDTASGNTLSITRCGLLAISGTLTLGPSSISIDWLTESWAAGVTWTIATFSSTSSYFKSTAVKNIPASTDKGLLWPITSTGKAYVLNITSNSTATPTPTPTPTSTTTTTCSQYNCSNGCTAPTSAATCDSSSGYWVYDGDTTISSSWGSIDCGVQIKNGELYMASSGQTLTFGSCGTLYVSNGCANFDENIVSLDFDGITVSNGYERIYSEYSCLRGYIASFSFSSLTSSGLCQETVQATTYQKIIFRTSDCSSPAIPAPAAIDCSKSKLCSSDCSTPVASATCSDSGAWSYSGSLTTAQLGTIECELIINGNLTGSGTTLTISGCGKITVNGNLGVTATPLTIDLSDQDTSVPSRYYWAEFTSATATTSDFSSVSLAGLSSDFVEGEDCFKIQSSSVDMSIALYSCADGEPTPPTGEDLTPTSSTPTSTTTTSTTSTSSPSSSTPTPASSSSSTPTPASSSSSTPTPASPSSSNPTSSSSPSTSTSSPTSTSDTTASTSPSTSGGTGNGTDEANSDDMSSGLPAWAIALIVVAIILVVVIVVVVVCVVAKGAAQERA